MIEDLISKTIPREMLFVFIFGLFGIGSFVFWFIDYYNTKNKASLIFGGGLGLIIFILCFLIGVDILNA
jgi:glucose-6-phosphate-specific signal transduction histidine kinase